MDNQQIDVTELNAKHVRNPIGHALTADAKSMSHITPSACGGFDRRSATRIVLDSCRDRSLPPPPTRKRRCKMDRKAVA
jgi:hypothetical protein